jgi:hypothetical protein
MIIPQNIEKWRTCQLTTNNKVGQQEWPLGRTNSPVALKIFAE